MKIVSFIPILIFVTSINAQDLRNLDGSISDSESKSLIIIGENGDNRLMISSSGGNLKVAVESKELYVASLCICNEQNEVTILHASAALGQIVYKKEAGKWTTEEKFNWQMRETGMDAAIIAKRKRYLDNYGWVANTMGMGNTGETEFIINPNMFGDNLRLAIGLMTAENPENIIGIPSMGAGDCADQKLVSGDPKTSYLFNADQWIGIE